MEELTAKDLPKEPSAKLIDWVLKKQLHNVHALAYRSGWYRDPLTGIREKCVDVRCSVCGAGAKMDIVHGPQCCSGGYYASAPYGFLDGEKNAVIHGECTMCPICGAEVEAIYASRISDAYTLGDCTVLDVQNIQGRLCLLYWKIWREINDTVRESVKSHLRCAFVVEHKKITVWEHSGANCGMFKRHQYKDVMGKGGVVYPWKPKVLEGTTAENSKLDLYMKAKGDVFPVSYLRLWMDRPTVENLLVQGAGKILAEMIRRDCKSSYWGSDVNIPKLKDVNWKDKRPAQMLGLTKEEFRWAVRQEWSLDELEIFRKVKEAEPVKPEVDMPVIRLCGDGNMKRLLENSYGASIMKAARYLAKQRKRDTVTLTDYWRLVQLNGGDLTDPAVRWPQDLHRAHDNESAKQRFERQKGYPEKFAKRTAQLQKMSWEADGLLIRPVECAEALYQEGKQLHHCVYSYLDSHVNGQTAIFLIRKVSEPEKPFYTLELNEKNFFVKQNRGLRNCGKTPEVQAFEDKWIAWLNETIRKEMKTA